MFKLGLYEQIINKIISTKLSQLDKKIFFIKDSILDKEEASTYLTRYLSEIIQIALSSFSNDNNVLKQIELSNKIISLLNDELKTSDFQEDIIETEGKILNAVLSKIENNYSDLEGRLKQITPYTRFTQSELFTGGSNLRISLESELKKEILSSNEICFLVSFIKYAGIRIFQKELIEFTKHGGKLKVITTSYMGATDVKAVEFLSGLDNTEVRLSYNTQSERLHAKAYLFLRDSGFHTGYIGSSNLSRSAVTNGMEWNLKVTTKEVSHIIDKFKKTFETYWMDPSFELFDKAKDVEKLQIAIDSQKNYSNSSVAFFDITPFSYQKEILEKLDAERKLHGRFKNLIVAATGTGKTVVAAFDYKTFKESNRRARLLFVAHRKEILEQAQSTFRGVLKDNNFGDLWVDGLVPRQYDHVFASVQTLNNQLKELVLPEDYFDFIIIDEVHHIAAKSYRPVINRFKPTLLLGLTATPERMDNENILADFCNVIAAEIRLPEALNKELLCPFQYFGITDSVDLSKVIWEKGKYVQAELTEIYMRNFTRIGEILKNLDKYLTDLNDVRTLGFCVSQEHAKYMADNFRVAGLKADWLTSSNSDRREEVLVKLKTKAINYLFVVDIFNEGVDVPEIDTILFLRPTESLTVFLQQLGRGLRKVKNKECLSVLDFVGNSRPEYDFEKKFRALIGKTNTSTFKEIEDEFPHIPLNCSIVLEQKAKEYILSNIAAATNFSKRQLLDKIRSFSYNSSKALTLRNFINEYNIALSYIYKKGSWLRFCAEAGIEKDFKNDNENEIVRAISKKWLLCNSISYLKFILHLVSKNFEVNCADFNDEEQLMCIMLHYDVWQEPRGFENISESLRAIGKNVKLNLEIKEVLEILIDRIDFIEKNIELGYPLPLKMHSRYTRDQICAAFGHSTFQEKSSSREGVINIKEKNTELLFITLEKSSKEYSPSTLYDDYAINERLFHWQSQNSAKPSIGAGLSYISQKETKKIILLFVRERNNDEFGNTMGYVFLGNANYVDYYGQKPMSITWELHEPIPPYMWKESAKMATS